jgi:hypothetical protein
LGSTFFDASASAFIMPSLLQGHAMHSQVPSQDFLSSSTAETSPSSTISTTSSSVCGVALGPEWVQRTNLKEQIDSDEVVNRVGKLEVEYGQEVSGILTPSQSQSPTSPSPELKWQRLTSSGSSDGKDEEYSIPHWAEPISVEDRYPLYLHTTANKVCPVPDAVSLI